MPAFPVTKWTLIVTAGQQNGVEAEAALSELCSAYWYPAYAFVRRMGHSADDSRDLTQEFFARFLEKRGFADADPSKGRFRSFLLTCIKRFLADHSDLRHAAKRGGREGIVTVDPEDAENRYAWHMADFETPERLFERAWALTLIARVNDRVREAFSREGRAEYFDRLKHFLPGNETGLSMTEVARELGSSEGALKVAVHRLRRRYRDMFRSEISHLVSDEGQVDDEIAHILQVLRT